MKHISKLVEGALSTKEDSIASINPEAVKVVDDLFRILAEHTRYFRLNNGSQEDYNFRKREWVKTFAIAGIGEKSVARGINRIRALSGSMATLTPGEFLELCAISPQDIGAPNLEDAYLEACKNSHPCETQKNWSHKVVRYATHKTGSHFLRTEPKSVSLRVFTQHYYDACQMFFDGRIMEQIGNDSPQLRRELEETQKIVADGYEEFNSPTKALGAMKKLLR